jgi:amidophosphoribosyltransferase
VEEIRKYLGLDGLGYLSVDGMVSATGLPESNFCLACFNGQYPVEPDTTFNKLCLER